MILEQSINEQTWYVIFMSCYVNFLIELISYI